MLAEEVSGVSKRWMGFASKLKEIGLQSWAPSKGRWVVMRRALVLGVMAVGIALLLWAGWPNLRERKLAMQKARDSQMVLIPEKQGQASGQGEDSGLAPVMRGKQAPAFALTSLDGK